MDTTAPVEKPIEVSPTALPAITGTLLRYALTALAGVLVTKGFLPADSDVNELVGIALAVISTGYGIYLAKRNHAKLLTVAESPKVPNDVARVKGVVDAAADVVSTIRKAKRGME